MALDYDKLSGEDKRLADLVELGVRRAIWQFVRPALVVVILFVLLIVLFGILPAVFLERG